MDGEKKMFILEDRIQLYTYDYARPNTSSISKYTSTSEDERTGMLRVKGSRSMSVSPQVCLRLRLLCLNSDIRQVKGNFD
jgi:hypothetical protein